MSYTNSIIISKECFIRQGTYEAKHIGESKVIEQYTDSKKGLDKTNLKVDNVEVYLLNLKKENNIWVADYRYTCSVRKSAKRKAEREIINSDYSCYFTLKETEMPSVRYQQMNIQYFYLLYGLESGSEYPQITDKIHSINTGGTTYQEIYFSLKYCYEFLQIKPSEDFDFTACKKYRYRGWGCYIQGEEWHKFFEEVNNNYFNSTRSNHQEIIAQELLWLHKEYGYTYEDIRMALEYIYKIKGSTSGTNVVFVTFATHGFTVLTGILFVFYIRITQANCTLDTPKSIKQPLIAIADTTTVKMTFVAIVGQIFKRSEGQLKTGSVVGTAHGMCTQEMAIELVAEPITYFGLNHEKFEEFVILLSPHHLIPWIIVYRDIQCQLLTEPNFDTQIRDSQCVHRQIGFNSYLTRGSECCHNHTN